MKNIKPQEGFSNPDFSAAPADDVEAARQSVLNALIDAAQFLADRGVFQNLAVMFKADPLSAEVDFKSDFFQLGRMVLSGAFESLDDYGPSLEVEGKKYTKAAPTPGQAMTTLGSVKYSRARYRPTSRQGESFIPADHQLGLTEGNQTPAAAGLSMAFLSSLTARESADAWKRVAGEGPSTSTLVKLSGVAGRCLEECSTEVMDELRKQEELPENAKTLFVALDGVMMRMNAEKIGDDVIEVARWREASCGVVSLHDNDGNRLLSRYIGRLPEGKKQSLKEQLRQEVMYILGQNPDLNLVVCGDGEKGNWTFSESLNPDVEVLDFWHAAEYLMLAADAAFGSDEKASIKWFKRKRHILRHDPKGVDRVIDSLRYLLRMGRGRAEIRKALGYFRNNRSRMNYYHIAKEGYPIGSGQVEAANKMLVTHRLKRSGQRWGRDGGQGVLAFRALLKSDRLDRTWRMVVPKMARSKKHWDPPKTAANDNWPIRNAA